MNALYLYTKVMPYTIEGIKAVIKITNLYIHLVHYPVSEDAPYQLPVIDRIKYYSKSETCNNDIIEMIKKYNPKFIFASGWIDKDYLKIAKFAKQKNIPVIAGCDTQWRGNFRQKVAVVFSRFLIRKYFNYIMVAGFYQHEYARLLGFKRENVLYPFLSASKDLFNNIFRKCLMLKKQRYPHNLLFVGRFEKEKGIELLIKAYKEIIDKKGWTLTLVGNGSLKEEIVRKNRDNNKIIIKDFLQPDYLVNEIEKSGAFCLASSFEQFGVVIHEFASAGLPIIASNVCGATSIFLKEGYNGYLFKSNDINSLKSKLKRLFNLSDNELIEFSERSNQLSKSITPEIHAANFLKFLKTKDDF